MLISPDMNLNELIELMGTSHSICHPPSTATEEQAIQLRSLLIRDFIGRDTGDSEIVEKWMWYCLSVDPEEQQCFVSQEEQDEFDREHIADVLGVPANEISDAALQYLRFGPHDQAVRENWLSKPWEQKI